MVRKLHRAVFDAHAGVRRLGVARSRAGCWAQGRERERGQHAGPAAEAVARRCFPDLPGAVERAGETAGERECVAEEYLGKRGRAAGRCVGHEHGEYRVDVAGGGWGWGSGRGCPRGRGRRGRGKQKQTLFTLGSFPT